MSALQQQQHELELLNSNMENISHELEGLLLTNEPQCTDGDLVGAASLDFYENRGISSTQQMYWQCMQVQQQQHLQGQEQIEQELLRQQHLEQQLQQQQVEQQLQQQMQQHQVEQHLQQQMQQHMQQQHMQQQHMQQKHMQQQHIQQQHVKQYTQPQQQQHQLLNEKQQQNNLQLQYFSKLPSYFRNPENQLSMNVEHSYVGNQSTSAGASLKLAAPNINAVTSGYTTSNKYEFHYLRSQALNKSVPNANPIPLISTATNFGHTNVDHRSGESRRNFVGGGAYRKHNTQKYNNKKNDNVVEDIDYDKIDINLEELGLAGEDICVKNPVLRLLRKFRLLNYYLHDVFPFGPTLYDLPTQPKPMPYTMNIQYQVKNAARNCTIFMCSKERILNANKLLDREFYEECEKSLNMMRKLYAQLEVFKRIEFDHKRCQFVTEEAKVHAERLELLLEELSDQVRECNLLVDVFEWSIKIKQKAPTENLPLPNIAATSSSMQTQNNGQNNDDDDERDGNNHNTPPEIEDSGMRQPIRYIG